MDPLVATLIQAVVGLVQTQQQSLQNPAPSAAESSSRVRERSINEFKKSAPPPFSGATNPDEAENWIKEMEKAFSAMQCTDEEKDFRSSFYAKYFPRSKLRQLERQFLDLKQGSMSVEEYEAEFDRLSHFAPKLVNDDESRAKRFEEGLNGHIRTGLAPLHLEAYDDVVSRAKSLDSVWRQTREERKTNQKKRNKDSFREGDRNSRESDRSNDSERLRNTPTRGGQPNRDQKLKCSVCGGWHKDSDCRHVTGGCFRCGDLNHRIAQCLLLSIDASNRSKPQEKSSAPAGRDHIPPTDQSRGGRPRTQGHVQALSQQDVQASNAVVPGILSMASVFGSCSI
ncbi:uncharacterized protein LOC109728396 [Ananas comosus]|uniref:Uncharacterized protein LOC109728396 n=1 Tax=Ananas comosus TaxID=4615 RepID=A0A6P5HIT7_ANACO|nr:uncharacterized protein LOC109728396 [Ananas comosus]